MSDSKTIVIDDLDINRALDAVATSTKNPLPLMRTISAAMLSATERNFAVEGDPSWQALSAARLKQRRKQGSWPGKILQVSGALARSITTRATDTSAEIGANTKYAAIHQFGGTIAVGARAVTVRLRTDTKGKLMRQGDKGRLKNLAVFASKKHKRAVERTGQIAGHTVNIPARQYLPATAQGELQSGVQDTILQLVQDFLSDAWD